jgi:hypothetical protein
MGSQAGKLIRLAWLLKQHGEAIEADLARDGLDLLDFYRDRMTVRRLWVLVASLLANQDGDGIIARPGTALARSLHGELGDWTRLDQIVGSALGVMPPADKAEVEWKRAQQARIRRLREERAARSSSGPSAPT